MYQACKSMKAAKAAKGQWDKKIQNASAKKLRKMMNSMRNEMRSNLKKAIVDAFFGLIGAIIDAILCVFGTSAGGLIAKAIDLVDNKRRNGYCFT